MISVPVEFITDPEERGFSALIPDTDIVACGEGDTGESDLLDFREGIATDIEAPGIDDTMERINGRKPPLNRLIPLILNGTPGGAQPRSEVIIALLRTARYRIMH